MALILLGAGATRGASFVDERARKAKCLPPLDADFFTQLQRIDNPKHHNTIDQLIGIAVGLFGNNFAATLENLFTTVEHEVRMQDLLPNKQSRTAAARAERRPILLNAVAAVLESSLTEGRRQLHCEYHKKLVTALNRKDSIISLNYDCLIDHTLREFGSNIWNPSVGYCIGDRRTSLAGADYWKPPQPSEGGESLSLLKLHGSLHFSSGSKSGPASGGTSKSSVKLKQRPYTMQAGSKLRFDIIPPEWNKHYDQGYFKQIWRRAAAAIREAETIVSIGYSFPATDLHTSSLFRISIPKRLKSVVIVNPSKDARRRTMQVLSRGLTPETRVLVYDRFAEFAHVPRAIWDRPGVVKRAKPSEPKQPTASPVSGSDQDVSAD